MILAGGQLAVPDEPVKEVMGADEVSDEVRNIPQVTLQTRGLTPFTTFFEACELRLWIA